MNTQELRKAANAIYLATDEAVAKDISEKLTWAADTIDELRAEPKEEYEQRCDICGETDIRELRYGTTLCLDCVDKGE